MASWNLWAFAAKYLFSRTTTELLKGSSPGPVGRRSALQST